MYPMRILEHSFASNGLYRSNLVNHGTRIALEIAGRKHGRENVVRMTDLGSGSPLSTRGSMGVRISDIPLPGLENS